MTLEVLGQCAGVAPAVWGCHSPDMTASLYLRRLPVPPHRGDKKWRVAPFGAVESGFTSCSGRVLIICQGQHIAACIRRLCPLSTVLPLFAFPHSCCSDRSPRKDQHRFRKCCSKKANLFFNASDSYLQHWCRIGYKFSCRYLVICTLGFFIGMDIPAQVLSVIVFQKL